MLTCTRYHITAVRDLVKERCYSTILLLLQRYVRNARVIVFIFSGGIDCKCRASVLSNKKMDELVRSPCSCSSLRLPVPIHVNVPMLRKNALRRKLSREYATTQ